MNDLRFIIVDRDDMELVCRANKFVNATKFVRALHKGCDILIVDENDKWLYCFRCNKNGEIFDEFIINDFEASEEPSPVEPEFTYEVDDEDILI